jgi:hypothetical protein
MAISAKPTCRKFHHIGSEKRPCNNLAVAPRGSGFAGAKPTPKEHHPFCRGMS